MWALCQAPWQTPGEAQAQVQSDTFRLAAVTGPQPGSFWEKPVPRVPREVTQCPCTYPR